MGNAKEAAEPFVQHMSLLALAGKNSSVRLKVYNRILSEYPHPRGQGAATVKKAEVYLSEKDFAKAERVSDTSPSPVGS